MRKGKIEVHGAHGHVCPSARDRGVESQARKRIPSGPVQMQSFSALIESRHLTRAYEFKGPVHSHRLFCDGNLRDAGAEHSGGLQVEWYRYAG